MKLAFTFILALTSLTGFSQEKLGTFHLTDEIIAVTVDRPGDLYLQTSKGEIQKFDINGNPVSIYKGQAIPDLFDPRDGARLFAYYKSDQHYSYFNPSFEEMATYEVDSSFVIEPLLACPAGDHNVWVIDAADKTLKKIDVRNNRVDVDVALTNMNEISRVKYMREYQGFVFILDPRKGIQIYSGMGRALRTIGKAGVPHFNFIGEELYYPEDGKLKFFNLFTAEVRELPLPTGTKFLLLTDERQYVIRQKSVDILSVHN